jgi:hypothetical protein
VFLAFVAALAACGDELRVASVPAPTAAEPAPPEHIDYVAPTEIGEVPDASRGTGDCTLRLRLRDADDGAPVAMYVRLWRLGVAEDAACTAGDQIQERRTVPVDGTSIERLPAGRYRVEVPDQRRGAGDPPEFRVGAGTTEQALDVRPRRTHGLRLRVYDEKGAIVRHLNGSITHDDWVPPGPLEPPAWTAARAPKVDPPRADARQPGKPSRCFFGRRTLPPLDGGPDGFDLGELRDAGRDDAPTARVEMQRPGCNDVTAGVGGGEIAAREASLVAVAVPYEALTAHVERPDGTAVSDVAARVEFAMCTPLRCAEPPPADAWRSAVVSVRVVVPGFEDLDYEWSVETADDRHVLRERRAK